VIGVGLLLLDVGKDGKTAKKKKKPAKLPTAQALPKSDAGDAAAEKA
jgi:hypothetical protein